ncbi:uncharacterized protein BJ212DRAFT_120531 [Suillus subaureus]|uniref:Uncharacterized protein n=1 Tax=Suillus subaureus TaxID=48587 RepID=A0A9P7EDD9_9AGAM|nr:uncharacterized protein BJ212DRAFT_120531 [Suillus subaureus]KAG1818017.1 hypothetical protein BJ212DRAFT_120531 [Suillus subaureus]
MFTRGFNMRTTTSPPYPFVQRRGLLNIIIAGISGSFSSFTFDSILALMSALSPTSSFLSPWPFFAGPFLQGLGVDGRLVFIFGGHGVDLVLALMSALSPISVHNRFEWKRF